MKFSKWMLYAGCFISSALLIAACQSTTPTNSTAANSTNITVVNSARPENAAPANASNANLASAGNTKLSGMNTSTMTAEKQSPAKANANGCWVHIWEDENYEDDNDVINGPGKWGSMRNLPGANKGDWGDGIDSLKVGPSATVTVWEDEDYKDNSQTYGPGTEKTNLRGNPDMGDQIDSMEIKCQ